MSMISDNKGWLYAGLGAVVAGIVLSKVFSDEEETRIHPEEKTNLDKNTDLNENSNELSSATNDADEDSIK